MSWEDYSPICCVNWGAMREQDLVDSIIQQWERERPELDPSPIGVIGRLSRISREIEAQLETVYARYGLDGGLYDALATLRRSGEPFRLRSSEFSETLMLTASGATKRLDRLERAGLIKREPDPTDRRAVHIGLTAKGRRLVDTVTVAHLDNERRLLSGLSTAEQRRLAAQLRKLSLSLGARPGSSSPRRGTSARAGTASA
jgi:DNA-binding MarR family transcriptional regulator